ncbi:MAG TPA: HAMP domain-containing sensor histidine kinase, partial [Myxococcota bacterium]|nr:HAMP domain-containing sensor histidine kinase [Myxococcota bacterium]
RAFSSDAAHELRTPLNRIANVAEVALDSGDGDEQESALETIRATTEELSQMVQSLLLLAELGDRRMALPWPTLDVDEWIARSVEMYAPSFEEQGVTLAAKSDAGRIEGDRTLLDRILVNLFDNALGCVPRGGRVEVLAQRSPGGVVVQVDDSGPGIPEAERERIFERFERGSTAGRASHGLGLAIARAVARLHGGELVAESSPLGGARFVLRLPVQRA